MVASLLGSLAVGARHFAATDSIAGGPGDLSDAHPGIGALAGSATLDRELPAAEHHVVESASPSRASLAQAFLRSDNLRAFAAAAVMEPQRGGVAYAMYARSLCVHQAALLAEHGLSGAAALPYAAPEDPSAYATRAAAFRAAADACASYSESELAPSERRRLDQLAAQGGDIFYSISGRSIRAAQSGDRVELRELLQAVLAQRDPLLLIIALPKLVDVAAVDALAADLDVRTQEDRENVVDAALSVLPCRFGLVCDARSPDVLASCLDQGQCAADRVTLVRDALPADQRVAFDLALLRLEAAVRDSRPDVLSRP